MNQFDPIFMKHGKEQGIDWKLLKAQCMAESNLNPQAVSPVGAQGLAQFMPATWEEWGIGNPFNAEDSIDAQARYMKWLIDRYKGNTDLAFAAYNYGIGNIKKKQNTWGKSWESIKPHCPKETQDYVDRINANFAKLNGILPA